MPTISRTQARAQNKPLKGIQTILFPKAAFTKEQAREWLKQHDFKYGNHRQTANFHRFMQTNPVYGAHYITKKLDNGVELVIMR